MLVVLFVNFRLRDSRLGRAWIALREDEVAAASMGVPLVKTKLLSYAAGGAFGGISGAFLGRSTTASTPTSSSSASRSSSWRWSSSAGSGASGGWCSARSRSSFVNHWLIPDVLDGEFVSDKLDSLGLEFSFSEVTFGVFGFLLVLMMVLRPEGLLPERRRQLELTERRGRARGAGGRSRGARMSDRRTAPPTRCWPPST